MQTKYDRKSIVVVGSINADLVAKVERIPHSGETVLGSDFQIHSGGKGANQAVAVARLGYPVFMIGKLGSDAFGLRLRESMSEDWRGCQRRGHCRRSFRRGAHRS